MVAHNMVMNPTAIPQMVSLANDVISNPSHQQTQDRFAQSLKELLDSIHATQAALTSDGTATDYQPLPASTVSVYLSYGNQIRNCRL